MRIKSFPGFHLNTEHVFIISRLQGQPPAHISIYRFRHGHQKAPVENGNAYSFHLIEHVSDPSAPLVTHTFVCVGDADLEGCTVLPSGPHLTLYNGEAYTEDGDSLSRARVERMVEYAGKKGLTVEGVPFGETICRWPRLFGEGSKVLHRLCVPVHR